MRNLAFTLCLYSGQMCTMTQAIVVPADGIATDQGHKSYDELCADLTASIDKFLADQAVATAVLGAIQSPDTLARIAEAPEHGPVMLASKKIAHAELPGAEVRSPVLLACDAADEKSYMEERFGPIAFVANRFRVVQRRYHVE
ncbi:PaaZ [Azoarcus sp. CIB]|nr:PaaZ [Azoarcus sp. CIB]